MEPHAAIIISIVFLWALIEILRRVFFLCLFLLSKLMYLCLEKWKVAHEIAVKYLYFMPKKISQSYTVLPATRAVDFPSRMRSLERIPGFPFPVIQSARQGFHCNASHDEIQCEYCSARIMVEEAIQRRRLPEHNPGCTGPRYDDQQLTDMDEDNLEEMSATELGVQMRNPLPAADVDDLPAADVDNLPAADVDNLPAADVDDPSVADNAGSCGTRPSEACRPLRDLSLPGNTPAPFTSPGASAARVPSESEGDEENLPPITCPTRKQEENRGLSEGLKRRR